MDPTTGDPPRAWWRPKDWAQKLLWTGLFMAVLLLVFAVLWTQPLAESVPATVTRLGAVPAGETPAIYDGWDVREFPFLKQATERADKAGGLVETLLPVRAWEGWNARVTASQPDADPGLVVYEGRAYRIQT